MKKIIIISILHFLLLTSCGYKVINNVYNYEFEIIETEYAGNANINKKLEKFFLRFKDKENSTKFFKIAIDSELIKKVTSKNSLGEDASYSIKVIVKLKILEKNKSLQSSSFEKSINYNNLDSKFELKQYENVLINDLVEQIKLDINHYLGSIK